MTETSPFEAFEYAFHSKRFNFRHEAFSSVNLGKGNLKISIEQSFSWLDRLPIDIDMAAIIIMESLGVVSFFVASLFLR